MKRCTKCGKEKPLNEFSLKSRARRTRQSQCKVCVRLLVKDHYARNREYYLQKAQKRNALHRATVQNYIHDYLMSHPCVDCGETDSIVLEFDHKRDKLQEIANLVTGRFPLRKVVEEIKKCDVRCANCHRRKTARQFGWSK